MTDTKYAALKGFLCTYNEWYVQPFFWNSRSKKFELDETLVQEFQIVNGLPTKIAPKVFLPQADSSKDDVQAKIAGEPLFLLASDAFEPIQGFTVYKCDEDTNLRMYLHWRSVIITKSSKPLFHAVSRGQCLDFMANLSQIQRKNEGPGSASRYDKIDLAIKTYRDKCSTDELKQPAIISQPYLKCEMPADSLEFNTPLFLDPGKGYSLVTLNTSYFDKTKPRQAPQFISISWNYFDEFKWSQRFNDAMRTNFNFAAVRKMLAP